MSTIDYLKGLIEKEIASDEVQNQRLDICKSCDQYFSITTTCKRCGCFMKVKVQFNIAKCPLEKW